MEALPHDVHLVDCHYVRPELAGAYLVRAGGRAAFVECNTSLAVPRLLAALDALGQARDTVDWVFVTHVHLDFTATSPQYPPGGVSGTRHRSRYQAFDRSEEASLGVEVQPILHVMPTVRRGAALRPRGPLTLHRGARIVAAL